MSKVFFIIGAALIHGLGYYSGYKEGERWGSNKIIHSDKLAWYTYVSCLSTIQAKQGPGLEDGDWMICNNLAVEVQNDSQN